MGDRRRDPRRVAALLRAPGRHFASEARLVTLAADAAGADGGLDERTVAPLRRAISRPGGPGRRSGTVAGGSGMVGLLFESLVIRDLRVLSNP